MASPPAVLVAYVEESLVLEYAYVAAITVATYDYSLNISRELRYLGFAIPIVPLSSKMYVTLLWLTTLNHTTPKKVLAFLLVHYTVVQAITVVVVYFRLTGSANAISCFSFYGFHFCDIEYPESVAWIYPTWNGVLMSYEMVLCALVLRYAARHLRGTFWRDPVRTANTLIAVIVHDNLVYFFVPITGADYGKNVNALHRVPPSAHFPMKIVIMETLLLSMVGPCVVLSLRRGYERGLSDVHGSSVTTLMFVAGAPPTEEEE
ncbi:hypothetical protein CONPUDRAFT_73721 [Coniophora puteana RWD-64-598 SS2]|uniref:Uncharacterized protein n=1 Tax=Coniophora puteana (strain RWD-64-598) TaxID=741705 RepID=A0A5M3MQ01_CONPW|nr:uncharacterized protein CONPUDRAFT_73721 [Coniophora puteana RWD-64-598 SS2]EIW80641.1 hypothetical protein CONPUDRAFT_73721 [Coniophora puteana RWD-64-598 SS2]